MQTTESKQDSENNVIGQDIGHRTPTLSPAQLRKKLAHSAAYSSAIEFGVFLGHLTTATGGEEFTAAELIERIHTDPNYQTVAATLSKRTTQHNAHTLGKYLADHAGKQHHRYVLLKQAKRGIMRYHASEIKELKAYQRYIRSVLSENGHDVS